MREKPAKCFDVLLKALTVCSLPPSFCAVAVGWALAHQGSGLPWTYCIFCVEHGKCASHTRTQAPVEFFTYRQ